MPKIIVNCIIDRPVGTVYKAYTDPYNMLKWSTDLVKSESIKGEFGEIGGYAHLHYEQKGRKYILKDELKFIDHNKKIVSEVSGQGLLVEVTTRFESLGDSTQLTLNWKGLGTILPVKRFLPLAKRKIRNQIQSELNTFKKLVEELGEKFV